MLQTFMGVPVFESPALPFTRPKLQVSPDFEWITPQCRAEFNAWLLDRFGTETIHAVMFDGKLCASRETILLMKANYGAQL